MAEVAAPSRDERSSTSRQKSPRKVEEKKPSCKLFPKSKTLCHTFSDLLTFLLPISFLLNFPHTPTDARRKRPPRRLSQKPNDIYVNRKSEFAAQLARCHKLLDQGYIH